MKGKAWLYGVAIFLILAAVGVFLLLGSDKQYVPLRIPSCGIETDCLYVTNKTNLREAMQKEGVSAIYENAVYDTEEQAFGGLDEIAVGDAAFYGDAEYTCTFRTEGYSDYDGAISSEETAIPEADFYACISVPDGKRNLIFIAGFDRS